MKSFWILVLTLFLIGCSDKDKPLVQRINEITVYDVGNAGNSSDIRIKFGIEIIADISDLRILVIPFDLSDSYTKNQALELSSDSYHSIGQPSSGLSYSLRLSSISDVEGNSVNNNKEYIIKILMVGEGFNQLSLIGSNQILLVNKGVLEGYYEGCPEECGLVNFCTQLGRTLSNGIFADILSTGANTYQGTIGYKVEIPCDELIISHVTFQTSGDSIVKFQLSDSWFTHPSEGLGWNEGKGIVIGDLYFEVFDISPSSKPGITVRRMIKSDD